MVKSNILITGADGQLGKCFKSLVDNNKYTEVSFMIFRTGSCLIVGNCTEKILRFVYNFIKNMLETEYVNVKTTADIAEIKEKKIKQRKKIINVTSDYYVNNIIK